MQFTYPDHPRMAHGFHLVGTVPNARWYPSPGASYATDVEAARDRALMAVTRVPGVAKVDENMSLGSIGSIECLHLLVTIDPSASEKGCRAAVEQAIRKVLSTI